MNELNSGQRAALQVLNGSENVFLTGAAGSGKSFLLRTFLQGRDIPVLASTGAAAILVGGRTFHSFFGLGIMEGGFEKTLARALNDKRLKKRLKKTSAVVIDEISMISGPVLRAAEAIARRLRSSTAPWGGMRIIAVGDFAQLPPVNVFGQMREWAFTDPVWSESGFQPVILTEIMRTLDPEFVEVLNRIRKGRVDERVIKFLDSRCEPKSVKSAETAERRERTRLFPLRADVERHNLERLVSLEGPEHVFATSYEGNEKDIETFRRHAPILEGITLKKGALVMLRQNDAEGRWVNGSLGSIERISDDHLSIRLRAGGRTVEVERAEFTLLNAEGEPVVKARNFPVSLAWAMTIHKAQGTTLDQVQVDLRRSWEPGQAYVALSRARASSGVVIDGWRRESIFADPVVAKFHRDLVEIVRARGEWNWKKEKSCDTE